MTPLNLRAHPELRPRDTLKPVDVLVVFRETDFHHFEALKVVNLVSLEATRTSVSENAELLVTQLQEMIAPSSLIVVPLRANSFDEELAAQLFLAVGATWPVMLLKTSEQLTWKEIHKKIPYNLFSGMKQFNAE